MKILTNARFTKIAGIAQALSSFLNFVQESDKEKTNVVGVDIVQKERNEQSFATETIEEGKFKKITTKIDIPKLSDAVEASANIEEFKSKFGEVIEGYKKAIESESPDIILINGTFYAPWCLLLASKQTKIPTVLHYHGSISKETSHFKEKSRSLMLEMEKTFDSGSTFYIFPSNLTKETVEKEVFGHAVNSSAVLPNAIPLHFFDAKAQVNKANKKKVGMVGRWTRVKNPEFFKRLALYNQKKGGRFSIHAVTDLKRNSEDKQMLNGLVKFRRPVENEFMAKFYQEMGSIICPSHFETYGNVAQEALACGTPALVGANMGVSETFQNLGLNNWIIDFNSLPAVYKKMEEVSGEVVPTEVRDKMREMYSPAAVHGQMLNILKSV